MPAVSLHAADDIHFDIEDRLRLYGLFYDRRKGEYRNLRKPIAQIISIPTLAKAVIAIRLQRPDDARARLQTFLDKEDNYAAVFNKDYDSELYVSCALLDRQVEEYLTGQAAIADDAKRDIRYYVDMVLAATLTATARPSVKQLADLHQTLTKPIDGKVLAQAAQQVYDSYLALGGTDKVAKGTELRSKLSGDLAAQYPEKHKLA